MVSRSTFDTCTFGLRLFRQRARVVPCRTFTRTTDRSEKTEIQPVPVSDEPTQTDFTTLDILGGIPPPTTAIDACTPTGIALNSGLRVHSGAVLLLGGEVFVWKSRVHDPRDWRIDVSKSRHFDIDAAVHGMLQIVWPKPDLLILGTGARNLPISVRTRRYINDLGIRIESQDTRNAAAQFNLLATERGVRSIAAALLPAI